MKPKDRDPDALVRCSCRRGIRMGKDPSAGISLIWKPVYILFMSSLYPGVAAVGQTHLCRFS